MNRWYIIFIWYSKFFTSRILHLADKTPMNITSFVFPEMSWYIDRRLLHSGLSGLSNSMLQELPHETNQNIEQIIRPANSKGTKKKWISRKENIEVKKISVTWRIDIHPGNESVLHLLILFAITYWTIKPLRSASWGE